jgi:hypothetical protein
MKLINFNIKFTRFGSNKIQFGSYFKYHLFNEIYTRFYLISG